PSALVDQPGLPGQHLPLLDDPDQIAGAAADPTAAYHGHFAGVAVDLRHVLAYPARGGSGIELGFDDDAATHDVQSARESQQLRHLCLPAARLGDLGTGYLSLYVMRHRHYANSRFPVLYCPETGPNALNSIAPGYQAPLWACFMICS